MPLCKTIRSTSTATIITLLCAVQAHASMLLGPACDAAGDSFKCRLTGILNFLYAAAGVLGLVLIVVVSLAVRTYQKNRSAGKNPNDD